MGDRVLPFAPVGTTQALLESSPGRPGRPGVGGLGGGRGRRKKPDQCSNQEQNRPKFQAFLLQPENLSQTFRCTTIAQRAIGGRVRSLNAPPRSMQPSDEPMRAGMIIAGKYRLEHEIGRGGMGSIWRAEQIPLGRAVALKFLDLERDGVDRETATHRFLREAQLAASVAHRMVVDIMDFAMTADGRPYMVMELLKGEPMDEWLATHPPVQRTLKVFELALSGLSAVHEAGIVHRDLKPTNIFIVADADGCFPKLLDFGISRTTGMLTGPATSRDGWLVGTPQYMSPEQARGVPDLDQRTDLYSLGVMMYEALAGTLPYSCPNVGDLLVQIVGGGAPPLSVMAPDVGQAISNVVERAMHPDRSARFQDAEQMRSALRAALVAPRPKPMAAPRVPAPRAASISSTTENLPAALRSSRPTVEERPSAQSPAPGLAELAAAAVDGTGLPISAVEYPARPGPLTPAGHWAFAAAVAVVLLAASTASIWRSGELLGIGDSTTASDDIEMADGGGSRGLVAQPTGASRQGADVLLDESLAGRDGAKPPPPPVIASPPATDGAPARRQSRRGRGRPYRLVRNPGY